MPSEKRWTIWVCSLCGKQCSVTDRICRHYVPSDRDFPRATEMKPEHVEVIRADSPNVLSVEEARSLVAWLPEHEPGSPMGLFAARLSTWADEQEGADR